MASDGYRPGECMNLSGSMVRKVRQWGATCTGVKKCSEQRSDS